MKTTLVTGIWDIGRGQLNEGWKRDYSYYLDSFLELLSVVGNVIVFIEKKYEAKIKQAREGKQGSTLVVIKEVEWFKQEGEIFSAIQKIRQDDKWLNCNTWLKGSPQAGLPMYNPIVMSKMFLLNDAAILDPFNSTHLFWVDGAITKTVQGSNFMESVMEKLTTVVDKFSFISFPYEADTDIHGFNYQAINSYAGSEIKEVARGGFFGGEKTSINHVNALYYQMLKQTLKDGYMGTEESVFSILAYKYPKLFNIFRIDSNGLLVKFFDDLREDKLIKTAVGFYVISFNSPRQFEELINSVMEYDPNFLLKTKKYLLNNSTDKSTDKQYTELCDKFGFVQIKKDNIGICGGRLFIAKHAKELDYYFFFEDDMMLSKNGTCRLGLNRYKDNLYNICLNIIKKEQYDFLKLSFTEFHGDNSMQWAWCNVPSNYRKKHWLQKPILPDTHDVSFIPKTSFSNISSEAGCMYIDGEVYYSNWPQLVSKGGNYKMFLKEELEHPYEQTWMSYIFQETVKGDIKPAVLLLSPVEHNRFDFYDKSLRVES